MMLPKIITHGKFCENRYNYSSVRLFEMGLAATSSSGDGSGNFARSRSSL